MGDPSLMHVWRGTHGCTADSWDLFQIITLGQRRFMMGTMTDINRTVGTWASAQVTLLVRGAILDRSHNFSKIKIIVIN